MGYDAGGRSRIGIFHRKARKTTFQRREKYFFCMYCINNDLKFTYVFRNFRFVGSNFEGLDHRVSRVSEKNKDLGVRLC